MLATRRPVDPFSVILRPGWERLKLCAWLAANDPEGGHHAEDGA
jgi:hypothetical protein